MLSPLCNDLQLSPCKGFCATLLFAHAAGELQNPKVWKELTRAGRKQDIKDIYLDTEVDRRVEKNEMYFYKISYGKASTSIN